MAFHPSRSLRLAFAALVLTVLAVLVLLAVPGGALAAKGCSGKSQLWKVNGKSVCLKTARPAKGHAAGEMPAQIKRWFAGVDAPLGRQPLKVPAKLLKARPKAALVGVKLYEISRKLKTKSRKANAFAVAAASSRGAVIDSLSQDGPSLTLDNGVVLSSHVDATAYADGSQTVDGYVSMKVGGYEVRYKPVFDLSTTLIPDVDCPTADGKLTIDHSNTVGGTVIALKGKRGMGAYTMKTTEILHSRGQVGRDARLASVTSEVTSKVEYYSRGSQVVTSTSGKFTISREGDPVQQGPLSANVKVKVAGASSKDERAAASQAAANLAASRDQASSLASHAELGRWKMMQNERKWYDWPYICARINATPDSVASLAPGKSLAVEATVESTNGGEASGSIAVEKIERGTLSVTKAELDPGAPAKLAATAVAPDAEKFTVGGELIATSTAGRAATGWWAKDDLDLPKKMSGVVATWTEIPGALKNYFHSWVVYTLKDVYVSDSGYISAFYDLTTADQDEVENTLGPSSGCRYVAKGSGGNIEAGDLELRKAPGGEWKHAIMYDVQVPNGVFTPTDCGPSPPPAFEGDIVGFLNMKMLGDQGFYDVGENFHLQEVALSYADPVSGRQTTADWILDPGDPQ